VDCTSIVIMLWYVHELHLMHMNEVFNGPMGGIYCVNCICNNRLAWWWAYI
jgi:hypothetical protein